MNKYVYDYISHTFIETLYHIAKYRSIGSGQYDIVPIRLVSLKDSFHFHVPLLTPYVAPRTGAPLPDKSFLYKNKTVWLDYLKHIEKYT